MAFGAGWGGSGPTTEVPGMVPPAGLWKARPAWCESATGLEGALPKAHGRRSPWPEKWHFREFPSLQTRAIRGTPEQPPYDSLKIQSLALCQYHHGKGGEPQPQLLFSGWDWKQHS